MRTTRWMMVAVALAASAGCTGSHPAASVRGSLPLPSASRTASPVGDAPAKLVATTTAYAPSKAPVHVDGRHAVVVSPTSFAIETSDNGNCKPSVRSASLRPPAVRITIDQGRCYVLNLVRYVAVVDVGVPIFSPNSHGPQIRTVDVVGAHGKVVRLLIVRA